MWSVLVLELSERPSLRTTSGKLVYSYIFATNQNRAPNQFGRGRNRQEYCGRTAPFATLSQPLSDRPPCHVLVKYRF
ncbi:hypothetical protein L873DRAFT_1811582 [Choiromyces venosus 120613-1]|uniref:Uncharacterized protein n=1 Tax=Choiromyces venosus 120613-1 TaxID=1336337 RepID=A0A3N4JDP6_9PEZI|nr:hypothetical protein L873DRAFT_1811582 [Choiromyces venosus 120613-1]